MRLALALALVTCALSCSDASPPVTLPRADATVDQPRPPDATADAPPADALGDAPAPARLSVLFVGNSYTYVNDLPALVARMSRAAGPLIETDSVATSGATLRMHWESNAAPTRIMSGGWSAVVLQGQSVEPVLHNAEFRTYAGRFALLVAGAHARAVFFATWPRRAGDTLYEEPWSGGSPEVFNARLDLAYAQVAAAAGGTVAHVGDAWVASLRAVPAVDLYAADGSHPSPAGTWLAACVIYRAITGSPPSPEVDAVAGVSPDDARALRELAAAQPP